MLNDIHLQRTIVDYYDENDYDLNNNYDENINNKEGFQPGASTEENDMENKASLVYNEIGWNTELEARKEPGLSPLEQPEERKLSIHDEEIDKRESSEHEPNEQDLSKSRILWIRAFNKIVDHMGEVSHFLLIY